jgi:hypothetical protein
LIKIDAHSGQGLLVDYDVNLNVKTQLMTRVVVGPFYSFVTAIQFLANLWLYWTPKPMRFTSESFFDTKLGSPFPFPEPDRALVGFGHGTVPLPRGFLGVTNRWLGTSQGCLYRPFLFP